MTASGPVRRAGANGGARVGRSLSRTTVLRTCTKETGIDRRHDSFLLALVIAGALVRYLSAAAI